MGNSLGGEQTEKSLVWIAGLVLYAGKRVVMRLIKSTLGPGSPGGLGIWGEGTREQWGTKGIVYEQPGTEVDDSYHNWRVPSK